MNPECRLCYVDLVESVGSVESLEPSMSLRRAFNLVALTAAATVLSAGPWAATFSPGATSGVQMPTDPAEAMAVFEGDVEKWGNGPVSYLFLREELEEWKELETDEDRGEFIRWFWDRRDDDLRDHQHPFREGFYTRVATANQRFSGFPRGWRSDRGRVWIILGRPDNLRTDFATELEIWSYRTYGGILRSSSVMGEMQVAFIRVRVATWKINGGIGPGAWPFYLLNAFDIVNQALIENPSLQRGQ